jgi:hypothetical protein
MTLNDLRCARKRMQKTVLTLKNKSGKVGE